MQRCEILKRKQSWKPVLALVKLSQIQVLCNGMEPLSHSWSFNEFCLYFLLFFCFVFFFCFYICLLGNFARLVYASCNSTAQGQGRLVRVAAEREREGSDRRERALGGQRFAFNYKINSLWHRHRHRRWANKHAQLSWGVGRSRGTKSTCVRVLSQGFIRRNTVVKSN